MFDIFIWEILHFLVSLIIGFIIYKLYYKSFWVLILTFFGGFLIDFDHFYDYYQVMGFNFDLHIFLKGEYFYETSKLYLFGHSWEYVFLFFLISFFIKDKKSKILLLSFVFGLFSHLLIDSYSNYMTVKGYSLIYRVSHSFEEKFLLDIYDEDGNLKKNKIY